MTERRRRRRKTPDQDAIDHIINGEDKSFLEGKFINTYKGKFLIHYILMFFCLLKAAEQLKLMILVLTETEYTTKHSKLQ